MKFTLQMNRAHFLSPHLCLCHRFYKIIVFNLKTSDIQLLLIYFSGIASSVLMNHNHGSFFWLLCFPWVGESYPLQVWAIFRSCPGSGQDLWQKQGKGSTTKRDPGKFLPWHVQDQPWNQHRSSLWSWFQEVLHFAGQVTFILEMKILNAFFFAKVFFVVSVFNLRLPCEQHLQIQPGGSSYKTLLLQNGCFEHTFSYKPLLSKTIGFEHKS